MNAKDVAYNHHVPYDIKEGTVVAYLVSKDDPTILRPLSRISLKPYTSRKDPNRIRLYPGTGTPYGLKSLAFQLSVFHA